MNREKEDKLPEFISEARVINSGLYWFLSLAMVLLVCRSFFLSTAWREGGWISIYCIILYLTYGVIYLLPSWLVSRLFLLLFPESSLLTRIVSIGSVGLTLLFLYTDSFLYHLYGFHINGFVFNLVFTPGGFDSMGGSGKSDLYFTLMAAFLLFIPAVPYYLVLRLKERTGLSLNPFAKSAVFKWQTFIVVFLVSTGGERITHGFANIKNWSHILYSAEPFPLYQPATFRHFAKKLGIKVDRNRAVAVNVEGSGINYPLNPLKIEKPEKPLNLVWLVSESWRWDMLDPEIMPATWAFAKKSRRFTNHFSGGNGTRMGLFSMFYSLYGPDWFRMLDAHRGPVLIEALKKEGYQWDMYTSAEFSYPEFNVTIFSDVEASHLHDDNTKPSWKDDRRNVGKMLDFIDKRDKSKPFMTFMFFESPHSRYYFPPENVIRKPYLEELNYATMDIEHDMPLIFNRYVNAVNHLDSQFARVFSYLEKNDLLKNTIVIVTGDHGEEFMEHGRWGHNSEFHNEQIHVPLIISIPGMEPAEHAYMTSHVDIVPTIAPLLGIKNPARDYALGLPLFGEEKHEYVTSAGWNSLAITDAKYKIRLPTSPSGFLENKITHADDTPLENDEDYFSKHQVQLVKVMSEIGRFLQH